MSKKKSFTILIVFLVISCLAIGFVGMVYYYYTNTRTLTFQSFAMEESYSYQKKPYCGFYGLVRYRLSEEEPSLHQMQTEIKNIDKESTMVLIEIELSNFLSGDISEKALQNFDHAFFMWSNEGYQIILRVTYDFSAHTKAAEPNSTDIICNHIRQIAPIVNKYKDSVYIMQGIFAGLWGEMHSSDYIGDYESMHLFADTLDECMDEEIFLSVRTPQFWRILTESDLPLDETDAYSGSLKSRMGLYNDAMLSSETDYGTYGQDSSLSEIVNHEGQGSREEEIDFQSRLCLYVPNGGEVISDNPYNDMENAVQDLSMMHVSYLNSGYDLSVLNKWKNSEYMGRNGYEYIADHLGYRYVLKEGNVTEFCGLNHTSEITVTLENTGFSPAYKQFTPYVQIVNTESKEVKAYSFDSDSRTWYPGKTVTLSLKNDFSFFENGTYDVYFSLKDKVSNYDIPCSNESSYDKEMGGYYLGRIRLE